MQGNSPDFGLNGQVAIVTGATSGLGWACARALGKAGAVVIVNHLPDSEAEALDVVQQIQRDGGRAMEVAADVSDEEQVQAMFAQVVRRFGTVHILINNAGVQNGAPLRDMSLAQWQKVIDVNLTGQFLCAREAVREFGRRGMQPEVSSALGKIVFMSSVHDTIPWACETNYAASKGGLTLLMRSMAQEFAHEGIRINAISPGAIQTDINRDAWDTQEALNELLELIPYGRIGSTGDVANSVLWLASDLSDYVVGTTLYVDGGMSLYPSFRGNG